MKKKALSEPFGELVRLRGEMGAHLTEIELELARTAEAEADIIAHLESCEQCRIQMDRLLAHTEALHSPLEPMPIPMERDLAIIALGRARATAIRQQTKKRPQRMLRTIAWALPLASAAAVALVLGVSRLIEPEIPGEQAALIAAGPDDINRDGRVDIIDAFALAQAIESGRVDAAFDSNADGKVDEADVNRLALIAVAVDPQGDAR